MKTVFLINNELNAKDLEHIRSQISGSSLVYTSTKSINDLNEEYDYIKRFIDRSYGENESVIIIHFSGNEKVSKELGDEISDMIIPIVSGTSIDKNTNEQTLLLLSMLKKLV